MTHSFATFNVGRKVVVIVAIGTQATQTKKVRPIQQIKLVFPIMYLNLTMHLIYAVDDVLHYSDV